MTKRQLRASLRNLKKAHIVAWAKPRSERQIESMKKNIRIAHKLPRTEAQLAAMRRNVKIAASVAHSMPRTKRQIESARKIVKFALAAQRGNPSQIELDFFNKLKKAVPLLKSNSRIPKTLFRGDLVNFETRRIVEVDGPCWHSKKRDSRRDKILTSLGWTVWRLPATKKFLFQNETIRIAIDFLNAEEIIRFPRLKEVV